jgi:hypothetical protein
MDEAFSVCIMRKIKKRKENKKVHSTFLAITIRFINHQAIIAIPNPDQDLSRGEKRWNKPQFSRFNLSIRVLPALNTTFCVVLNQSNPCTDNVKGLYYTCDF